MTVTLSRLDRLVTDAPAARSSVLNDAANPFDRHLRIDRDPDRRPARIARDAAWAAGWDWALTESKRDDLVQIVDALCVNALVHAKWTDAWPCVRLRIANTGRHIVVEVRDPDPTLPIWPTARPMDIKALIDDPSVEPDDTILIHRQGLVDVAGRAHLTAHVETAGKVVRAQFTIGGAK